ncbi:MAG: helix-turn-helix transcriptional regulator [Clostridia bacterium]|nr:helix-turn-helix transcriptional regulator [Clostridia bacterium]
MKKFAERLKELRTEKNLTQMQLSKETGLSAGAIGFWETEKRIPNAMAIIILAAYFHVSSDYLLGITDSI